MMRKTDRPYKDFVPVIFASVSWIFAFPLGNFNGFPVFTFIALSAVYYGTLSRPIHRVVLYYAVIGLLSTAAGAHWLTAVHGFALVAAIVYKALLFAVLGCASYFINTMPKRLLRILYWALLWVLFDAVSHAGALSFPYLCLPYSFAGSWLGLRLAGFGSLYLLSFIAAFTSASFVELMLLLQHHRLANNASVHAQNHYANAKSFLSAPPLVRAVLLVIFCFSMLFLIPPSQQSAPDPAEPSKTIALIQSNYYSFAPVQKDFDTSFTILAALTQQASAAHPDLIVWHETALVPPVFWYAHQPANNTERIFSNKVLSFLQTVHVPLLTGVTWIDFDDFKRTKEYNAAVLVERGAIKQVYKKMRLVPFAEYFPFFKALPGITRWIISLFGPLRTPGTDPAVFSLSGFTFSAPICFEDSYLSVFAQFGNLPCFIVLTEDSWSKSTALKRQHLAMSQMRAAETGSWIIRASNSGMTAVINSKGFIVAMLEPDTQDVLIAKVPGSVPVKHFAWFLFIPVGAAVLALLIVLCTIRKGARQNRVS